MGLVLFERNRQNEQNPQAGWVKTKENKRKQNKTRISFPPCLFSRRDAEAQSLRREESISTGNGMEQTEKEKASAQTLRLCVSARE
jgi:hypothetical protein